MKKSLLEIYALAVCFATLACFVIALGVGIYDLIELTNPEFTLAAHEYERYRSNEAFHQSLLQEQKSISDEQVNRRRQSGYESALRAERRGAVQSLTMVAIILIIDVVVFVLHWLLAKKARGWSPGSN